MLPVVPAPHLPRQQATPSAEAPGMPLHLARWPLPPGWRLLPDNFRRPGRQLARPAPDTPKRQPADAMARRAHGAKRHAQSGAGHRSPDGLAESRLLTGRPLRLSVFSGPVSIGCMPDAFRRTAYAGYLPAANSLSQTRFHYDHGTTSAYSCNLPYCPHVTSMLTPVVLDGSGYSG